MHRNSVNSGVIKYHMQHALPQPEINSPLNQNICKFIPEKQKKINELKAKLENVQSDKTSMEKENNELEIALQEVKARLKTQDEELVMLRGEIEEFEKLKKSFETMETQDSKPRRTEVKVVQSTAKSKTLDLHTIEHRQDKSKEPDYYCACGLKLSTLNILREHINYYSNGANFVCSICGVKKHTLNQFKHHMRGIHLQGTELANMKGCRFCGRLFKNLAYLAAHRAQEHGRVRIIRRRTKATEK